MAESWKVMKQYNKLKKDYVPKRGHLILKESELKIPRSKIQVKCEFTASGGDVRRYPKRTFIDWDVLNNDDWMEIMLEKMGMDTNEVSMRILKWNKMSVDAMISNSKSGWFLEMDKSYNPGTYVEIRLKR